MTETTQNLFIGYFPLWGSKFDSENVGIVGEKIVAYIPTGDEWRQVQKKDVWLERFRYDPFSQQGPEPPLCLVAIEHVNKDEDFSNMLDLFGNSMIEKGNDAVLALRLHKAGWFLDPQLSERIFSLGFFNQRLVGPYRQAFLGGVPDHTPPAYSLQIDELALQKDQASSITNLWNLIQRYQEGKPHTSAEIAIENFHRSYGYQLSGSQRAAFLFIALDAMFGGMSIRRIGEVEINIRFQDRVEAALRVLSRSNPMVNITPDEEAKWLDRQGRRIRNAIAHGRPSTIALEADENFDRIQSIIRLLLRQYLEFSVKWATQSGEISSRFDISVQSSPVLAYNKALENQSSDANSADLLQFDISKFH